MHKQGIQKYLTFDDVRLYLMKGIQNQI